MDDDTRDILADIPHMENIADYHRGPCNAWVYYDHFGRLAILLKDGGWLGIKPEHFGHY